MAIHEFTDDNFETEVLQSDVPVLVDFWAEWCGPCKAIGPTIEKIASVYDGQVKVGKVNIDENRDISMKFNVTAIPTVMLFSKGSLASQLVGLKPEDEFRKMIDSALLPH